MRGPKTVESLASRNVPSTILNSTEDILGPLSPPTIMVYVRNDDTKKVFVMSLDITKRPCSSSADQGDFSNKFSKFLSTHENNETRLKSRINEKLFVQADEIEMTTTILSTL